MATFYTPGAHALNTCGAAVHACGALRLVGGCTHGITTMLGVSLRASRYTIQVGPIGGISAGQVIHNSRNTNNITSIALTSSLGGQSSEGQQNKIINHIQEPGTYRVIISLRWKSNFEEIGIKIFTERGKTFTSF